MKFIELHDERDTVWVKVDDIGMIETAKIRERPKIKSCIYIKGFYYDCIETPEEILQKIAEAEQRDTVPTGFMDDWGKEVEDPLSRLSRLKAKKDGATDATDRW